MTYPLQFDYPATRSSLAVWQQVICDAIGAFHATVVPNNQTNFMITVITSMKCSPVPTTEGMSVPRGQEVDRLVAANKICVRVVHVDLPDPGRDGERVGPGPEVDGVVAAVNVGAGIAQIDGAVGALEP
jgi:hypothetical protein